MLAAVLKKPNDLVLEDVPQPAPGDGEVIVKVVACGFCATDYKAITGARTNVDYPAIVGHEPSGIVSAVGRGVSHFREGDEVIVQPSGYCGICDACREGRWHYCEHAFTTGGDGPDIVWPGAFAEYMKTLETMLFKKPATVSFDAAAFLNEHHEMLGQMITHTFRAPDYEVALRTVRDKRDECIKVALRWTDT